jgi:hypothetical protein
MRHYQEPVLGAARLIISIRVILIRVISWHR